MEYSFDPKNGAIDLSKSFLGHGSTSILSTQNVRESMSLSSLIIIVNNITPF
jgi:hypothetical protein